MILSTLSSANEDKDSDIIDSLYKLCKENKIEEVRYILPSISNKNLINQIQTSTGSTCLHVACYYGHENMVEILLDYGAVSSIRNLRHNLTPYEETYADNIRQLFDKGRDLFSYNNNNNPYIEWAIVDADLLDKRRRFRELIDVYKSYDSHNLISKVIAEFIHYYLNEYLMNHNNNAEHQQDQITREQIKNIEEYFREAIEKKDYLTYFIKAYTFTNDFHRVLNKHLALYILDYFDESKIFSSTYRLVNCLAHIVTLLIHHPNLSQYRYRGFCYRGMRITQNDLNQYRSNQHMLNRSFLSTSVNRQVAEMFAGEGQQSKMRFTPQNQSALQYSCLCRYLIKQDSTAIDVQTLSMRPEEEEVLILPFTVFKVVTIKRHYPDNLTAPISVEIELEECEDPNDKRKQLENMKKMEKRKIFCVIGLLLSILLLALGGLFINFYILKISSPGKYFSAIREIFSL